ncbi:[NiFe]-hydrogenase assembly chaperone HybE [Halomonas alkaliantarctica]|nr:[NiFe]-hydrogenase assembly chaperone HybE [Halomonas alkaliantarctica]
MQALSADEYALLSAHARSYRDAHLKALKKQPEYNPKLGVDALCFQRWQDEVLGGEGRIGALISPCALSLVAIPAASVLQQAPESLLLSLPSGRYRLHHCLFGEFAWYQRQILTDLRGIESMQGAAKLAQQLMERLMRPSE